MPTGREPRTASGAEFTSAERAGGGLGEGRGAAPTPTQYVLGIDAGGTKSVGLLADEQGRVLGEARGEGANLYTHGELHVEKVFDGIIETFANDHPISAVCVGIAGVDRPYDGRHPQRPASSGTAKRAS